MAPESGELVSAVYFQDSYIAFQCHKIFYEGNAVVAAKDAAGNILWSWHLWFTDAPQSQTYYNNAGIIQLIRKQGELISEEYVAEGIAIKAYVPMEVYGKLD